MNEPTTRALRAADAEARAQAQTVFDRPLIIEAGAGTGKTQTLVSRIVAWSVGPGWEKADAACRESARPSAGAPATITDDAIAIGVLRGVVAITFTEAAAAEMASRLGEVLAAIERDEHPAGVLDTALGRAGSALRPRARALLGALDHAVIRTIHAYGRRLLARYPLEAAVHPNLRVDADGSLQSEVVREIMEATIRRRYAEAGDGALLDLAERGIGPVQVEEALNTLIAGGVPADIFSANPFPPQRIAHAVEQLRDALDDLRGAAAGCMSAMGPKSLAAQIDAATAATLVHLGETRIETVEQLDACATWLQGAWPDALIKRLRAWSQAEFKRKEADRFRDRCPALGRAAALLGPLLAHWQRLDASILDLARRAIGPLLAEAYQQLRQRGIATYAALLHDTRTLLECHPETAATVRREIDQLLVDEFQDTDVVQCAIVRTLALSGPVSERPTLFLVGDPKQSIYGWRSADLRAYDDFVATVIAHGGVRHVLSVNYRSVPAILAEVGRTVEPNMQRAAGLQPAFQPLIPASARAVDRDGTTLPSIEYWVSWPWNGDSGEPRRSARNAEVATLEARALAADLRRTHDEHGVPWREIAVLFRSGGDLDAYLGAFREADVPYLVEGDRQYYERREVIDAAALLRTILEPNDQLALLTLLRSPLIGVPDVALLPLWSRRFPDAMAALVDAAPEPVTAIAELIVAAAAELPADIDGLERVRGWEHSLIRATTSIATLRASFANEPVDTFVERLRTMFLPEATAATRRLGAYRLANLQRFFRQLLAALEHGETDPQHLTRRIRTAITQRVDAEEELPGDGADDAVHVLTIHRAKGLDFSHVYVMQLHKEPGTTMGIPTEVSADGEQTEYRLFTGRTLGFGAIEARRRAVAAAEQVRTLYVAMTRAKSRLVLAGKWPADRRVIPPDRARSQMRLLLARQPAAPDLEGVMRSLARDRGHFVEDGDVRWVFTALTPGTGNGAQSAQGWRLDVAATQAAAERLDQLIVDAASRSARRFVAAVSETVVDVLDDGDSAYAGGMRMETRDHRVARAAGIVVHATLEAWLPPIDPREALRRQTPRLCALLRGQVSAAELDEVLESAAALLDRFDASVCGITFRAIADHIVARELPVIVPPANGDGPTGCYTGTIDLLYRDPATRDLVVADYKTDYIESEDEIARRVARYRHQGAHYTRAVREALQLTTTPRFELWFLHPGRIEVV